MAGTSITRVIPHPLRRNPKSEEPLDSFRQGLFEPEDLLDNGPMPLYQLSLKVIMQNFNVVPFTRKIPFEVCDNLMEAFRLVGPKNMCSRLVAELNEKRCHMRNANFNGLELKNKDLVDFVEAHSKTLRHLNISQCSRLTKDTCRPLLETLVKVKDPLKLYRQVTCYEVANEDAEEVPLNLQYRGDRFLWRKVISNQHCTLTTTVNNSADPMAASVTTVESLPHPLLTDLEMYHALGLLDDLEFCERFLSQTPFILETNEGQPIPKMSQPRVLRFAGEQFHYCVSEDGILFSLAPSYHSEELEDEDLEELETFGNSAASCGTSRYRAEQPYLCNWTTLKQQLGAPKRLNNSSAPYRRVNRSSSSAAGAHISRRFESTTPASSSSTAADSGGSLSSGQQQSTASQQQPPASSSTVPRPQVNFDVPMAEDEDQQQDEEMLAGSFDPLNNTADCPDFVSTSPTRPQNSAKPPANVSSLPLSQLQQQSIPSTSTPSNAFNLISGSAGGPPATSASCPSLDSSIFIASAAPGPSGVGQTSQVQQPVDATLNHPPVSARANSQIAYTRELHPFGSPSSPTSSSNPPVRSITSQSTVRDHHQNFSLLRHRSGQYWPSTSSGSTSSPPSPSSLFAHDAFVPSLGLTSGECPPTYAHLMRARFYPYEVFKLSSPVPNKLRIIEVRTWEEPQLESLALGKSAIPSMEEFTPAQMTELLFNPQLPHLKRLSIHEWPIDLMQFFNPHIDQAVADRLLVLDLSNCSAGIGDGSKLTMLRNLRSLILFNCPKKLSALNAICEMKSLRHLDLSTSTDQIAYQYHDPNEALTRLMESLPNLTSLDISGTNLAGFRQDIIVGLEPRRNNPLEFLGIFHTSIEASYRQDIPAKRIAGDTFENLILTSCEAYIDRVEILRKCLNELFQLFRYEVANMSHRTDLERSLKILVSILGRHPTDKLIQVAASATLFYIVKLEEAKPHFGRRIKELIVSRLLDAMQQFRYDQTMLRNGCLNLIHFRIPSDVISEYTRLADILLYIVTNDDDDFVQRLGIYLLNSLACQVDGEQKTIVGNLGAIEKMLQLIEIRFNRGQCDEVMETAWSTMWNVTDETPINCERFLNNNGLEFFSSCMDRFAECPELLRNMMGLLGNVSECGHLRYRLMKPDYIARFVILLDSQSDGIEVSYNSAGILAHIASDGAESWSRHLEDVPGGKCSREEMLKRMELAISRWEINSKRNINYRSFEPILRLLRVYSISWQAQYWAAWALANLTRVHCSKYCRLLEKDEGLEVLQDFLTAQRPDNFHLPTCVKRLAAITLFHVYLFKHFGDLRGLEKSSDIEKSFTKLPQYLKPRINAFFMQYGIEHLARELGWTMTKPRLRRLPQRMRSYNLRSVRDENSEKDSDEGVSEDVESVDTITEEDDHMEADEATDEDMTD